jgi:four helix bundle protein
MFEFQQLEVYKKSKEFYRTCQQVIHELHLSNYIKDQLFLASFSVALNIAEGSDKFSKNDRKNYFITARASVFECVAILDILCDDDKI